MISGEYDEDYRRTLCEQADFYGMESLTEGEQCIVDEIGRALRKEGHVIQCCRTGWAKYSYRLMKSERLEMEDKCALNAAKEIDDLLGAAVEKNIQDCPTGFFSGVNLSDIANIIMNNQRDETRDLSDDYWSSDKVDEVLIALKQKEVDEQIRSNKVVEGILKDIYGEIGYVREAIEQK